MTSPIPPPPAAPGRRIQHHLLLCATASKNPCCDPAIGNASWQELKRLVRDLGLERPDRPAGLVLRSKVDCLRVCSGGPILLIWPEGITYGGVTAERIGRIVREHIIEGRPIQDWILSRTPFAATTGP